MFLIRCNRFLYRKNDNLLNLYKHSTVYYSDGKKSSDDNTGNDDDDDDNMNRTNEKDKGNQKIDKKSANKEKNASKSISPESQNRLNELLKKLSARSTLGIVQEVQTSKPLGYKNLRKIQRLDAKETKPKNVKDAARAVSNEFGDERVEIDILSPYKTDENGTDFLEYVLGC